ncbi:MAG: precorrin-2 dehydrogenase/sirohydrochlorin ferrochelatase family protein, partial [Candidatus Rokuibacteriota bacterium]
LTVVSPTVTRQIDDWAREGRIRWIPRGYESSDLTGQSLAFVATDDGSANADVARDGRAAGVPINAADDPAHCDFFLPAVLKRGDLTVAVSTGGASPALSRAVRDELAAYLAREDYGALVGVAADVRRALRDQGARAPWERWRNALGPELRSLVTAGRLEEARERLREDLIA